jgi:hypothetical protein
MQAACRSIHNNVHCCTYIGAWRQTIMQAVHAGQSTKVQSACNNVPNATTLAVDELAEGAHSSTAKNLLISRTKRRGESKTTKKKGGVIMEVHVAVVCSVVGFLGFVVLILGVAGEAATAKALARTSYDIYGTTKCQYRATAALGCGIVAALLVITAQVGVTAAGLCCGCCQTWEVPKQARRIVGMVLAAVSWYAY